MNLSISSPRLNSFESVEGFMCTPWNKNFFLVTKDWYEDGDYWKINLVIYNSAEYQFVVGFKKPYIKCLIVFPHIYIGNVKGLKRGEEDMLRVAGIHVRPDGDFETFWHQNTRKCKIALFIILQRRRCFDKYLIRMIVEGLH